MSLDGGILPRVECPQIEYFTRCGKKSLLYWLSCKTAFNSAEHRLCLPSPSLHNPENKEAAPESIQQCWK